MDAQVWVFIFSVLGLIGILGLWCERIDTKKTIKKQQELETKIIELLQTRRRITFEGLRFWCNVRTPFECETSDEEYSGELLSKSLDHLQEIGKICVGEPVRVMNNEYELVTDNIVEVYADANW
jgi:hypothetical protein